MRGRNAIRVTISTKAKGEESAGTSVTLEANKDMTVTVVITEKDKPRKALLGAAGKEKKSEEEKESWGTLWCGYRQEG